MGSTTLDTHLNSPLSTTIIQESLFNLRKGNVPRNLTVKIVMKEIETLLESKRLPQEYHFKHDSQHLNSYFMELADNLPWFDDSLPEFQKYWTSILSFVPYELVKLGDHINKATIVEILSNIDQEPEFRKIMGLYNFRRFLEQGVCLSAKFKKSFSEPQMNMYPSWTPVLDEREELLGFRGILDFMSAGFDVTIFGNTCLFTILGEHYLTSRGHFLLISDLISQRFIILLTALLARKLKKQNYPKFESFPHLFKLGDDLIARYGNQAFNTLSLWEPIIIGEVLKREPDPAIEEDEFFNKIKKEFCKSQGSENEDFLMNYFESMIEPWISSIPSHQIFQLFGLYRIWGHPTINEIEGVKKLRSIACRPRVTNQLVIDTMTCKWREYFCFNYYAVNKKWPSLSVSNDAPLSPLILALKSGIEISRMQPGYDMTHWKFVTFEKTFDVPEKFELSEMIADKATSFNWKDLKQSCIKDGNIGPAWRRNVIIQWLATNYNNPLEFLTKIDQEGFDPMEKCVGVHPKERELKIFCRLFGLLTIEKRLYVVVTEAMLADHLFRYFPEITMTFDAVTLNTRIHSNTMKQSYTKKLKDKGKGKHYVIVNMDFNKWNSYMREEETIQLFTDFDNLFGFKKVFSRTHEMFKGVLMYLADGTITPFDRAGNLIQSEAIWTDHLGGIEGLRQKGWTIFTVVLLKYISEIHDVKCQIMGQGDNQVLILEYQVINGGPSLREKHNEFLIALNEFLSHIGPPLKMEETWSSSHFFIYGKFPVFKGKPMSLSMKKLCRTMRLTNEGFQNLESTLSSISANASAATASDYDPVLSYIIGTFETLGAIDLHLRFPFYDNKSYRVSSVNSFRIPSSGLSVEHKFALDNQSIKAINRRRPLGLSIYCLIPCILGGFPSLHLCDLMNHGFPDPLSLNIWSIKHLLKELPSNSELIPYLYQHLTVLMNSQTNEEMLCQDPVSLNLLKSSSGGEKFKRMVFEFLTTKIEARNQVFLTFLRIAKTRQTELSTILCTMKPMNPRVANSILSSTIVGRAMKVISKVNKTGTLINLMDKFRNQDILREQEEALMEKLGTPSGRLGMKNLGYLFGKFEQNYLTSVTMHAFMKRKNPIKTIDFCSTEYAQRLRVLSWGLPITGVTVAVPQELLKRYVTLGTPCSYQNHPHTKAGYIKMTTHLKYEDLIQPDFSLLTTHPGPFKPFFGSKTQNKVKYEGGELKKVAPPMMNQILNSLCLIGWGTSVESNLTKLLLAIFSSYTDLDPMLCIPDSSKIAGSVEHRWGDLRTSHSSSLSILYESSTHMTISTNLFEPYLILGAANSDNVNVNYQSIFTWISSCWSSLLISYPQLVKQCYHYHIDCEHCVKNIYEGDLEIDDCTKVIENLKSLEEKDNPYCWISKEHLLPGINLSSIELLPRDHLNETSKVLSHYLSLSVVENYIQEFPSVSPDSVTYLKIVESSYLIPINVSFNINLSKFIHDLIGYRLIYSFFLRSNYYKSRSYMNPTMMLRETLNLINNTSLLWFKGMLPLTLNLEEMNNLRKDYPSLEFARGTPPSQEELCHFFKKLHTLVCLRFQNREFFIDWLNKQCVDYGFLSNLIVFNPFILYIIRDCFSMERGGFIQSLHTLSVIHMFFIKSKNSIVFNSNSDLYSLMTSSLTEMTQDSRGIYKELLSIKISIQNNMNKVIMNSMDNLSKLVSKRTKLSSVSKVDLMPDYYTNLSIDLKSLESSSECLFSHVTGDSSAKIISEFELIQTLFEMNPRSLYNHYLKIKNPLTTASYKLISILNYISRSGDDLAQINNTQTIGCFGDGVGGYTMTCGRVFQQNPLFYNTLYEFDKLSSVGIDNYVPSAIGMIPSIMKRVMGIEMTTERVSDLTDAQFPVILADLKLNFGLIISDAEGGGWDSPEKSIRMTESLVKISIISKNNLLIIKSYGSNLGSLYIQYVILKQAFTKVEVVRSHFSSIGNTEIFFIARKLLTEPTGLRIKLIPQESDKIYIKFGAVSCPVLSYEDFSHSIRKEVIFKKSAKDVADNYSDVLDLPEWTKDVVSGMEAWLLSLTGGKKNFVFPTDLVHNWRKETNLVKFTEGNISSSRLNFLTSPVMSRILTDFFLVKSISVNTQQDFEDWVTSIQTGYFVFYGSIDYSWSVNWRFENDNIGPNSKTIKISDLISMAKLKDICIRAGRLTLFKDSFKMLDLTLSNVNPSIHFCTDIKDWWKGLGKRSYPLAMTPSPRYEVSESGVKRYYPIELTIPLSARQLELQQVYESDNLIKHYIEKGYVRPTKNLRDYVFARPSIKVTLSKERLYIQSVLKNLKPN